MRYSRYRVKKAKEQQLAYAFTHAFQQGSGWEPDVSLDQEQGGDKRKTQPGKLGKRE